MRSGLTPRSGLKPIGPVVPNWATRPILHTLVQVDWEPGPTEIVPNWAPRPILQTLVQVDWEPGPTEIVPNWAPHFLRPALGIAAQVIAVGSKTETRQRHIHS